MDFTFQYIELVYYFAHAILLKVVFDYNFLAISGLDTFEVSYISSFDYIVIDYFVCCNLIKNNIAET